MDTCDFSSLRGDKIRVKLEAVPKDAISNVATVIWGCLSDDKVGRYHQVMFNAGKRGVIFKSIRDSEIDTLIFDEKEGNTP